MPEPTPVMAETRNPADRPGRIPAPTPAGAGRDPARLLVAIVESSDDAILSKDLDGIITSWNTSAERMYGYTADEIVGRPVALIVPPEARDDVPTIMRRLRRGERIDHFETVRVARDGRRIDVSLTISPLHDDTGRVVGASTIARDITPMRLEARRWQWLSEVGQALTRLLDPEALLRELAALLVRELADYAVTYRREDGSIRRVAAAHADPAHAPHVERLVELAPPRLDDEIGPGAVIRTGEPLLAPEVSASMLRSAAAGQAEYLEVLTELNPISTIVLPLRARGRIVGAVSLVTTLRSGRRYGPADLALGRELAERAALALDNARLYREVRTALHRREAAEESLRRRYGQLRALYRMTAAVERATDVNAIYERALDGLRDGLAVDRASILLVGADGVMRFTAWRGLSDGYRAAVEGHNPWAPDARGPAPIVIPDVSAAAELAPELRATILAEGIRAMAFVPLLLGGRLLGKFMLYAGTPRAFADDEVELARTIAGTIAFAITRLNDELSIREAKEAAEGANAAKSQFLGVMSHELRTPLNAVLGYTELLLLETRGPINAEQREQLERIRTSARHQLELVEELLAYTRLEVGREEPRVIETDVRRIVHDVAELVRPEADAKGLRFSLELPDEPLVLRTDPARLRQIVLNLAGNATKYTAEGVVTIRARLRDAELVLEVADTGPGIADDKLDYIFEPFARVDEGLTRATEGSGLGLAIAQRLAALIGGGLRVRSRLGQGSTFVLTLPDLEAPADPSAPPVGR